MCSDRKQSIKNVTRGDTEGRIGDLEGGAAVLAVFLEHERLEGALVGEMVRLRGNERLNVVAGGCGLDEREKLLCLLKKNLDRENVLLLTSVFVVAGGELETAATSVSFVSKVICIVDS